MRPDIGRFLAGRDLKMTKLLHAAYEVGTGQGRDVGAWIDGLELVFGRGAEGEGRGFLRVMPLDGSLIVAFPRGHELFDPLKRLRGVPGSQKSMTVFEKDDMDAYFRRLVDGAYALEPSKAAPAKAKKKRPAAPRR